MNELTIFTPRPQSQQRHALRLTPRENLEKATYVHAFLPLVQQDSGGKISLTSRLYAV